MHPPFSFLLSSVSHFDLFILSLHHPAFEHQHVFALFAYCLSFIVHRLSLHFSVSAYLLSVRFSHFIYPLIALLFLILSYIIIPAIVLFLYTRMNLLISLCFATYSFFDISVFEFSSSFCLIFHILYIPIFLTVLTYVSLISVLLFTLHGLHTHKRLRLHMF